MKKSPHIVLGITGSIAAIKAPDLVRLLQESGFEVSCVLTEEAAHFVSPLVLATFCGRPVVSHMFGPEAERLPHVKLAEEADLFLIAPASATCLARCAWGTAEDMVSLTYLATSAPVLVAPAMHTAMWKHPATQENVAVLKKRGVQFVGPIVGKLASGLVGEGHLSELDDIVKMVETVLKKKGG
ncbi:MAG: phosphopantothenoylcysteine decarboxylase [Elusimicrobia bacterium]|nr:phosphopantothenoylcysteine decarboxylase [Candidatus Obscuribacterium magneticum]